MVDSTTQHSLLGVLACSEIVNAQVPFDVFLLIYQAQRQLASSFEYSLSMITKQSAMSVEYKAQMY